MHNKNIISQATIKNVIHLKKEVIKIAQGHWDTVIKEFFKVIN